MNKELIQDFLRRNRQKRLSIHCIGDAMIDQYYNVKVKRISPEFPMPIMLSESSKSIQKPGGAANVAYQLKHFNASVQLLCFPDKKAARVFTKHGINRWPTTTEIHAKLPIKTRFIDNGVQVKRWDVEQSMCGLCEDTIDHFIKMLAESVSQSAHIPDVAIMSDYDKGFFSSGECNILDCYRQTITIVDPKKAPLSRWKGCTIFKPNSTEAVELSGKKRWREQARHFQNELECESVVITFGGEKVAGIYKNEFFCYQPNQKVEVESVIGAGDCFGAFFAMAVGHGFPVPEAAEIAWNAGAIYVQCRMNRPIVPAELATDGVVEPDDLANRDFKLVLTNGCFDILHSGHMETLRFAKEKGDKLVVALNSDDSIKRIKDPTRPVKPLAERVAVMSSLKYVDFVVTFDEDTPIEVIKKIKPDVIVKGSEYDEGEIIGADIVPEVHRAPMIKGVSTSQLLAGYFLQQQH